MEIGMLNFWLGLLVTAQTKENYFSTTEAMIYFLTKKVKIGICGLMNDFKPFSFIGAMSPFWKAGKKTIIVIILMF